MHVLGGCCSTNAVRTFDALRLAGETMWDVAVAVPACLTAFLPDCLNACLTTFLPDCLNACMTIYLPARLDIFLSVP